MSPSLAQPNTRPDLVDLMLSGASAQLQGPGAVVGKPAEFKDSQGRSLAFASTADLIRGIIQYAVARQRGDVTAAGRYLATMSQTLATESLAFQFTEMMRHRLIRAMPFNCADDLIRNGRMTLQDLVVHLYSEYAARPPAEVQHLLAGTMDRLAEAWQGLCVTQVDEDLLSAECLKAFYEGREFPLACTFRRLLGNNLTVAHAALPLLVAKQHKATAVFDFGGNSGLTTSAMAASGIPRVLLADLSHTMLEFARWHDRRMGLGNIEYLELGAADEGSSVDALAGAFDFGVCTEVLEHTANVELAIATMAKLLRVGGVLFQSASFGHYPYPTHLRRNVVHAGHEDDLMRRFSFERIPLNCPIPLQGNERLYRKTVFRL